MKLKYCVILTIVAFLLVQSQVVTMFLPLVGIIQNLSSGEASKAAHIPVPAIWHQMASPFFGASVIALSLASMLFTIRGVKRERGSKAGWIVLLVFGVIVLVMALIMAFVASAFSHIYYDLGVK